MRHRQPDQRSQPCRQQFVGQNTQMLGIVPEFHHPGIVVLAQHQVALRAASHSADMLHDLNRHVSSGFLMLVERCAREPLFTDR